MPFPTFNALHAFTPEQAREIEQYVSYVVGYLSEQHKDDGSHGAVTADSVTATGAGTFDGNVTADADDNGGTDASPLDGGRVITGTHAAPGGAVSRGVNGIDVRTTRSGSTIARWRIGSSDGGGTVRDLLIQDLVGAVGPYTLRLFWDGSEYALEPEQLGLVRLGTNTTGERFSEVNALIVRALDGYLERGRTTKVGEWESVEFSAGNFTGNGSMTWTLAAGDQTTFAYTMVGKTMTVALNLVTTTVGGTPNTTLQVTIPGGFTAAKTIFNAAALLVDNAARTTGSIGVASGSTIISIVRTDAANWTASTDNTAVLGEITFEVQ